MKGLRRFLVVQSLMLWQGGFLFYATFVVPEGTRILGSPAGQGLITRRVTDSLNVCGVAAVLLCLWDLGASGGRNRWRWGLWLGMLLTLGGQLGLHPAMDHLLDESLDITSDPGRRGDFRVLHRVYLWLSTIQWLMAVGYVYLTLRAWRNEDRRAPT